MCRRMSEEYLLAWSEHHATFFSAMSELVSGDLCQQQCLEFLSLKFDLGTNNKANGMDLSLIIDLATPD